MSDYDVIVVGCGPVGALAANLLGKAGLRTLVLDSESAPYSLPRAVHIDHEMARLMADVGLWQILEGHMLEGAGHIHIGAEGGVIRYMPAPEHPRQFGHANDYFFFQPELEATLRDGLDRFDFVQLRLGAKVVGVTQDEFQVTVTLADGEKVSAPWLIGCDGARSTVRKSAQIALDDLEFDEPWLVVDAEVEGPITFPDFTGVPETADLQTLSVMLCDPRRPATLVPGRGNHRRWEFMLLPGEDEQAMTNPTVVQDLIAPWLKDVSYRLVRAATYRFHGLVAKEWRRDRIFIAGDAAHQTPPFFGQGMCHGLRDVANLAWKLSLVQSGRAPPALLETYQVERDAQVRHVIGRAVEVGRTICILDPQEAEERDAQLRMQGGMKTTAELIVPISSHIIGKNAGERFINPRVADGLLDDLTNGGWLLIKRHRFAVSDEADAVLRALNADEIVLQDINNADGQLTRWLNQRGADAVLLRPDHYVGLVCQTEDLSHAIMELGQAIGVEMLGKRSENSQAGSDKTF